MRLPRFVGMGLLGRVCALSLCHPSQAGEETIDVLVQTVDQDRNDVPGKLLFSTDSLGVPAGEWLASPHRRAGAVS
ncbi:MAG: hypothetical protein ABII00_05490 [Elusimicrobiota bacterium]